MASTAFCRLNVIDSWQTKLKEWVYNIIAVGRVVWEYLMKSVLLLHFSIHASLMHHQSILQSQIYSETSLMLYTLWNLHQQK